MYDKILLCSLEKIVFIYLFFYVAQFGFKTWEILLPQPPRIEIIRTHNYTNKKILFTLDILVCLS